MNKKYRKLIIYNQRLERRLINRNKKVMKKAFLEIKQKIIEDNGAEHKGLLTGIIVNWNKVKNIFNGSLKKIYGNTFEEILKGFQINYEKKLESNKIRGIRDYFLEEWNKKNAASRATQLTESTKKILNNIITEAQKEGKPHKEVVKEILEKTEDMSKDRANAIARTETSKSINTTSYETADEIGMVEKCWIHIGGKKTFRQKHKALNGKWIKIEDVFVIGDGIEARYPHDDKLPASEVVHCSCMIIFR